MKVDDVFRVATNGCVVVTGKEVVLAGEEVAILLEVDSVKIGDKLIICSE